MSDDKAAPTIAEQLFHADCSNSHSCRCQNKTNLLGQTSYKHRTNLVGRLRALLSAIRQFDVRPQVNSSGSYLHNQSRVTSPSGTASCRPWTTKMLLWHAVRLRRLWRAAQFRQLPSLWPVTSRKHPHEHIWTDLSRDVMCHMTDTSLHEGRLCHTPR